MRRRTALFLLHCVFSGCVCLCLSEAAARLKQLELENNALSVSTPPKNVNVNMALNNLVRNISTTSLLLHHFYYAFKRDVV